MLKKFEIQRISQWLSLTISGISALVFCFAFLVIPMRTFQQYLGERAEPLIEHQPFLLFISLLSSFLFLLLFKTCTSKTSASSKQLASPPHQPRWLFRINILLLVIIFIRISGDISSTPLDWDEQVQSGFLLTDTYYRAIDPLVGTMNHSVAAISSLLSMNLFGASKFSSRLPALFYLAGFLFVLFLFAKNQLSSVAFCFVLIALALNPLFLWYGHSMRGYMSMMFSTLTIFTLLSQFTRSPKKLSLKFLSLFCFLVFVATFTHDFAILFCGTLMIAFVVWLYRQRFTIESEAKRSALWLVQIMLLWAIIGALVSVFRLIHLDKVGGFLFSEQAHQWWSGQFSGRLYLLFGMSFSWQIHLLILGLIAVLTIRFFQSKKTEPSFPALFLGISTCIIFLLTHFLKASILEGRMLLAFLPIFLIWLAQSLYSLNSPWLRYSVTTLLIVLLNGSALFHPGIKSDPLYNNWQSHETFLEKVVARAASNPLACVTVSAEHTLKTNVEYFYLDKIRNRSTCKERLHVHIEVDPNEYLNYQGNLSAVPKQGMPDFLKSYTKILDDNKGRQFYANPLRRGENDSIS